MPSFAFMTPVIVNIKEQIPKIISKGIPIRINERIELITKYIKQLINQFKIFLPCLSTNSLWPLFEAHIAIGNTIPASGIKRLANCDRCSSIQN